MQSLYKSESSVFDVGNDRVEGIRSKAFASIFARLLFLINIQIPSAFVQYKSITCTAPII